MKQAKKIKSVPKKREIKKALATINDTTNPIPALAGNQDNQRGLQIYTMSQLMAITGTAKDGQRLTGYYDQSIHYLNLEERISIYRLCAPVHSVVSGRMNAISGMDFDIVSDRQEEDKIYDRLKTLKGIHDEYRASQDMTYIIAAGRMAQEIKDTLIDILPDLSNFDKSLLRWSKRIKAQKTSEGEAIKAWLLQPNINDRFEEFIKKIIFDLMVHGSAAVYKEILGGRVENFYLLPGGTVVPLKNKYIGGVQAYVQVNSSVEQPQIFFGDELSYSNYMPSTARAYGFIPLEALINKVSETMLFDRLMADQADGTKPPEKMVVIAESSPFGDLNKEINVPIAPEEQKRVEQKINAPKKNAIMTFSGNTVQVVDLSRENTMGIQMQRQKDITAEVGMVFQATAMEMNLSGSENTSGRSTSDAQAEIYQNRGIMPLVKIIEMVINRDILPFRFGPGWKMDYQSGVSEKAELEMLKMKMDTGLFSVNEIRIKDLNEEPFADVKFNEPMGAGAPPDGSTAAPLNFKTLE